MHIDNSWAFTHNCIDKLCHCIENFGLPTSFIKTFLLPSIVRELLDEKESGKDKCILLDKQKYPGLCLFHQAVQKRIY
jgi:hypothetical protein